MEMALCYEKLDFTKMCSPAFYDIKRTVIKIISYPNNGSLGTNPNFDANIPPFEVRGCKSDLGGAF